MKLLNCHIVNFGRLQDVRLSFSDGINLIYAENGVGKTTLVAFIKAMLYGLPAGSHVSDITKNERLRYLPWQGGAYGGSLTFEIPSGIYRIERFFGAKQKDDRLVIYDTEKNLPTEQFGASVGDTLFAVDADGFERTLYISQRMPDFDPANQTVRTRLGTLTRAADDLGDFTEADARLDAAMKRYKSGSTRGRTVEIAAEIERRRAEIAAEEERIAEYLRLKAESEAVLSARQETEAAILAVQEQKKAAADRRLRAEQTASYRRLRAEQDKAMRELMVYEELFHDRPPTDGELAKAERLLAVAEGARMRAELSHPSDADAARLAALRARYGDTPPASGELDTLQAAEDEARRAEEDADAARPLHTEEIARLSAAFPSGLPTAAEADGIRTAAAALTEARHALEEKSGGRRGLLFPLLCFALALLSGAGGLALLAHPVGSTLLLSLSGCGLLCGAVLLLLPRLRRRHLYRRVAETRAALIALLSRFAAADKDPLSTAEAVLTEAARLTALSTEDEARLALQTAALARRDAARDTLRAFGARYGFADGALPAIHQLRAELAELTRLRTAAESAADIAQKETRTATAAEDKLTAFFAPYGDEISALPHRAAYDRLRQDLLLSRKAAAAVRDCGASLQAFLEESGFDPSLPLPPIGEDDELLSHREKELSDRKTQQTADLATIAERISALADCQATRDRLCAEKSALEDAYTAALHTHRLLETAKRILTEAKQDLTTRYLRHMEKSFDGYMQQLSDQNDPFFFDVEMRLFTERQGARRSVEQLSRGQRELAHFCARLSLIDAVFRSEPPFLLLDDPFVNLDDGNYAKAVALLRGIAAERQVFCTVCSRARIIEGATSLSLPS